MAGDWIKMRNDLPNDPAVIRIRRATGTDADAVVGKLHRLWSWADAHTTDGRADGLDAEWVDEFVGVKGFAECMICSGWLSADAGGIVFANFERHNGAPAKVRALRKTRMERLRGAARATDAPPEKRREEKRRDTDIPAAPVSTTGTPAASGSRAKAAGKVLWTPADGWQGITDDDRREWAAAFPGAVLDQELAKATAWLKANPQRCGKRNWRRFVVGWLQRCQDKGGTNRETVRPGQAPIVVRRPREDMGGQSMSDDEYARERRRLAQQAQFRREKEQAMAERRQLATGPPAVAAVVKTVEPEIDMEQARRQALQQLKEAMQ